MEIVESKHNGVVVLALSGRLDASNASLLEQQLLGLIDAGERRITLDCAGLDYISSAGLRVLLVAVKRLRADDGRMVLAALKDPIKEIFDIAGFSSIFEIFPTRDAALAACRA